MTDTTSPTPSEALALTIKALEGLSTERGIIWRKDMTDADTADAWRKNCSNMVEAARTALQSLRQISQPDSGRKNVNEKRISLGPTIAQQNAAHEKLMKRATKTKAAREATSPAPLDLAVDDEPRPVEPAGEITNSSILRSELNSAHVQLPPEKLVSLCWKAADFIAASQSPGHTDLMVTPESIDAFMEANPLPADPHAALIEAREPIVSDVPAWKRIIDLFAKHGLPAPPTALRDELVTYLAVHDQFGGYRP